MESERDLQYSTDKSVTHNFLMASVNLRIEPVSPFWSMFFMIFHIFSIGLSSELLPGQSRTWILLLPSHSETFVNLMARSSIVQENWCPMQMHCQRKFVFIQLQIILFSHCSVMKKKTNTPLAKSRKTTQYHYLWGVFYCLQCIFWVIPVRNIWASDWLSPAVECSKQWFVTAKYFTPVLWCPVFVFLANLKSWSSHLVI